MSKIELVMRGCIVWANISIGLCMMLDIPEQKGALTAREKGLLAVLAALLPISTAFLLLLGIEAYSRFYPLFVMLPMYGATWIVKRYRGFKQLFVFLTALIWESPLLLMASTAAMLFPGFAWARLTVHVALSAPMLWLLHRYFKTPLTYLLNHFSRGWALFCAVPILNVMVSYHMTLYRFTFDVASFRGTFVWLYSLGMSSFLTYSLIVRYASQIRTYLEEQSNGQLLQAQLQGALHYARSLKRSRQEAARYEHDLRHHLQYISALAQRQDTEGIKSYTAEIEQRITEVSPRQFCGNETVNLILSAYHARAARAKIGLEIQADIPQTLGMPDSDLCVILSNALENALRAAGEAGAEAGPVSFQAKMKNEQLFLEISNPYAGEIAFADGLPVSRDGKGIGVKSIRLAVEALGGIVSFETHNRRFSIRVIL